MKIIVAEDDSLSREIINQILKKMGHEVRSFPSGDEAWESFKEEPAEVVFSDWIMPGMDGLESAAPFAKPTPRTTSISSWPPVAGPATPTMTKPCGPVWTIS